MIEKISIKSIITFKANTQNYFKIHHRIFEGTSAILYT